MGKKGNILGDPFKDFVRDQINQRQESLGKYTNIEDKDLLYYNSKTPWLRLASSIDIYLDSQTAKDYILQGGVVNYTSGDKNNDVFETGSLTRMKSGIGVGGAYKFLEGEDRGNVPLPGITSADVKYENNGALTLTTVKIKCFSRAQLNIIDKLYLRPGFSMLLEFGWSVYLDNGGILQTFDEFTTPPLDSFMNGTKDQYEIQKEIEEEQEKHCGNYEAILGVVTNFSWDIQNDGTYDCMIEMSGVGEVIETIGVESQLYEDFVFDAGGEFNYDKTDEILGFDPYFSKIHAWVSMIYSKEYLKINSKEENNNVQEKDTLPQDNLQLSFPLKPQSGASISNVWVRFGRLLEFIEKNFLGNDKNNNPFPKFDVNYDELEKDPNYIQINKFSFSSNPQICVVNFNKDSIPLIKTIQTETTITSPASPLQEVRSGDKIIQAPVEDNSITSLYDDLQKFTGFINEDDPTKGRLMNVGLSIIYITKTTEKYLDRENGHFSILEFLQTIISDINKCLGGINEIEIQSDKGYVRFISKSPNQLMKLEEDEEITTINIHGVIPKADNKDLEGSFVRNANVKSEIPKNFSSMVAIGAMANDVSISKDATSFRIHNLGLRDRIFIHKERKSSKSKSDSISIKEDDIIKPVEVLDNHGKMDIELKNVYIGRTYRTAFKTSQTSKEYTEEEYNDQQRALTIIEQKKAEEERLKERASELRTNIKYAFKEIYLHNKITDRNVNLLQNFTLGHMKDQQPQTQLKTNSVYTPFFLPYNVSLDMDGLSGMTLYQIFRTTKTIFPSDYEAKKINLVVNSLNHNITPKSWITQISAYPHPKLESKDSNTSKNNKETKNKSFPNANRLREWVEKQNGEWIIRNNGSPYGDELTSSGEDMNSDFVDRIISLFNDINSNYIPKIKDISPEEGLLKTFEITAGNDKHHSNLGYSSHPRGSGIDIIFQNHGKDEPKLYKALDILISVLEDKGYTKFPSEFPREFQMYIDEYRNPSERMTGGHIHIQ